MVDKRSQQEATTTVVVDEDELSSPSEEDQTFKDLSNKLKKELYKLTEKSELLETVLPLRVKNFIRKWREKDRIARLWKPESV